MVRRGSNGITRDDAKIGDGGIDPVDADAVDEAMPSGGRVRHHPSNSRVQKDLERPVRERAALSLGLEPAAAGSPRLEIDGAAIELDGWYASPPVAFEVFACVGKPKGGQKHKLRADMLKLALVRRHLPEARLIVVVTSADAAAWLRSGWNAAALRQFEIEVVVIDLTEAEQLALDEARVRQRLGNRSPDE